MKRPLSVILSAIVVLLGSALVLAAGVFLAFVPQLAPRNAAAATAPPPAALFYVMTLFMVLQAAWGFATGAGLLARWRWSRFSILIYSGLLVVLGVIAVSTVWVVPMPIPSADPESARSALAIGRLVITLFYGAVAVLGGIWLYVFNRARVKEYFQSVAGVYVPSPRPVAITIIGWWILICSPIILVQAVLRFPTVLFGEIINGWAASVLIVILGGLNVYAAWYLLKLRESARRLMLGLFAFGLLNGIVNAVRPGYAAKIAIVSQGFPAWMRPQPGAPTLGTGFTVFITWMVAALMLLVIIFLVAAEPAFARASQPPTTPPLVIS